MATEFHIGIDDTDSDAGGCTTYTGAVLFQRLVDKGIRPFDFPWLVRLNPNIPWKTRGNGAVSIHMLLEEDQIEPVKELTIEIVETTSDMSAKRTDPAVVFLRGAVPEILNEYSEYALYDVISVSHTMRAARKAGVETRLLKGTRGVIGSLAAIGAGLDFKDHTFEIIAYRTLGNRGTLRRVDRESIRTMDSRHGARTFHNLDPRSGRILVCPHGPDPVLLGIRGLSPTDIRRAFREVRINEPVERVMIFRTNQGTDAHLTKTRRAADLAPHQAAVLEGTVETFPRVLRGGHVIFQLTDDSGTVECAAYTPTRTLAATARELLPGDHVRVYGGVRGRGPGRLTLNLEKIDVLQLAEKFSLRNPLCSVCGGRCETMGRGQGFRCKKCGLRNDGATRTRTPSIRNIREMTYTAVVGARRHLSSPGTQITPLQLAP